MSRGQRQSKGTPKIEAAKESEALAQEGTSQTASQLAADFLLHLTAFYKL